MRLIRRLVAVLMAFVLAAPPAFPDELPELGDVASSEFSLATERRIGQQIMSQIRWREPSYLDDPDIEAYINQLGSRLVAVSDDPGFGFTFFVVADPAINAFAMPGGYIGVHTGLILAAQSESELAGVLAHEISHVTQRHIARQIYQSKKLSMASMVAMGLALLAARSNPQAAGAAVTGAQAGAISAQLAYSRDFERESDRIGFDMLRRAGFDPAGMAGFFTRLQQTSRLYENNATAYLRTHPLTGERLSDMQNREQGSSYRQVPDSADFQLVRARVRALEGRPSERIAEFEAQLRDRKFVSEAATRYGLAVAQVRAGDWRAAEREVVVLRRMNIASPMVYRLAGQVKLGLGESEAGLATLREGLARFPLSQALAADYGGALNAQKRFRDALLFADEQLVAHPQNLRFHQIRADAYGGLGQRSQYHFELAEMSLLKGQTAGAIEQLEIAQKAGDANFYEMSVIDARMREAKRRQLEEMKERRN